MAFELPQPPIVQQFDENGCWAASFNSWSRASGIRTVPGEEAMIGMFSQLRGALVGNHAATRRGIHSVGHLGFMTVREVRGVSLTASFFETNLRSHGYIYLAYTPNADGGSSGHVVVVYGVTDRHALVMDPDPSVTLPCHVPLDWYQRRSMALVGTSILGTQPMRNPFA